MALIKLLDMFNKLSNGVHVRINNTGIGTYYMVQGWDKENETFDVKVISESNILVSRYPKTSKKDLIGLLTFHGELGENKNDK